MDKKLKIENLDAPVISNPLVFLLIPMAFFIYISIFNVISSIPSQNAQSNSIPQVTDNYSNNFITDNQTLLSPTQILTETITPTPTITLTLTLTPTVKPTQKINSPTPQPTLTPTIGARDYSKPWTVAPGCPTTTLNCIPCTSGSTCRYEPGESHGFIGWSCQNNNPGNIRNASTNMATDFKNLMIVRNGGTAACGVRYDVRGGSYFVFANYSAGIGALKAYLKGVNNGEHSSYTGCGDCTLTFFFSLYAGGDTNYDDAVATEIGEPVTQTLRYVVANKLDAFVQAIKNHEGFFTQ
jgi:hypothetical protein